MKDRKVYDESNLWSTSQRKKNIQEFDVLKAEKNMEESVMDGFLNSNISYILC